MARTAVQHHDDYRPHFYGLERERVWVLDEAEAAQVWDARIDSGASGFFQLPDSCWVVSEGYERLGRWLEAFAAGETEAVGLALSAGIDWADSEVVCFLSSREIALECNWSVFRSHWSAFLGVDDDCPVLVARDRRERRCLYFTPLGEIRRVGDVANQDDERDEVHGDD